MPILSNKMPIVDLIDMMLLTIPYNTRCIKINLSLKNFNKFCEYLYSINRVSEEQSQPHFERIFYKDIEIECKDIDGIEFKILDEQIEKLRKINIFNHTGDL